MELVQNDRPSVKLLLTKDGLAVSWGPDGGPWGTYAKTYTAPVTVTRWELYVGTKANPMQADDPDEPSEYEIFNGDVGTATTKIFSLKDLPRGQVLARVIGFFYSQDETGQRIEEGIYSDVERQLLN